MTPPVLTACRSGQADKLAAADHVADLDGYLGQVEIHRYDAQPVVDEDSIAVEEVVFGEHDATSV
jgi:hypothetical protein